MANLTSITVAGRIGRDAETKQVGAGTVTEWSMAANHKRKGEETTMWFRCALWGKRGEALEQYLTKGSAVLVIGTFNVREYEGKSGATYSLDVNVQEVSLLGGGSESAGTASPPAAAPVADDSDVPF